MLSFSNYFNNLPLFFVPSYWAIFGTMTLFILTWQDVKHVFYPTKFNLSNKNVVDDRKNYFMLGVTVSLVRFLGVGVVYFLFCGVVSFVLSFFVRKSNILGEADISTLRWCFLGFGLLGLQFLIGFYILFFLVLVVAWFFARKVFRVPDSFAFFPFLLGVFVTCCLWFGFY